MIHPPTQRKAISSRLVKTMGERLMRWQRVDNGQSPRRGVLLLAVVVLFGLGLRTGHYLVDPPVWHDESVLIFNALNKDFSEMLGPLYYSEACPPLFLAVEKAVALALGDGTYALRLVPFLASCTAMFGWFCWQPKSCPAPGLCGLRCCSVVPTACSGTHAKRNPIAWMCWWRRACWHRPAHVAIEPDGRLPALASRRGGY